jgi:hypothetical protein
VGANVVITGTVSHLSPYFRPRIGLTLQAISPDVGRVVASVDGLWDSNSGVVAARARSYFAPKHPRLRRRLIGAFDGAYADDLVLESPHLFAQFVCGEAARLLVGVPGLDDDADGGQGDCGAASGGCAPAPPR